MQNLRCLKLLVYIAYSSPDVLYSILNSSTYALLIDESPNVDIAILLGDLNVNILNQKRRRWVLWENYSVSAPCTDYRANTHNWTHIFSHKCYYCRQNPSFWGWTFGIMILLELTQCSSMRKIKFWGSSEVQYFSLQYCTSFAAAIFSLDIWNSWSCATNKYWFSEHKEMVKWSWSLSELRQMLCIV